MLNFIQVKALSGQVEAIPTKNLFLKDKKGRLYIVTALPKTKIELPKLSARLGCGKGGLRFAPDELLEPILGVKAGCVSPLALVASSSKDVVLLLDDSIRNEREVCVHPLENSASLVMTPNEIETFLRSKLVGREPIWVDFKAAPIVDKDNPPDLKPVADAANPIVDKGEDGESRSPGDTAVVKPTSKKLSSNKLESKTSSSSNHQKHSQVDIFLITESVLKKAREVFSKSELNDDDIRRLQIDVNTELNALRNAAYSAGFTAAKSKLMHAIDNGVV